MIPQGPRLYSSFKQHVLTASAIPSLQVISHDQEGSNALTTFSQQCSIVMLLIIGNTRKEKGNYFIERIYYQLSERKNEQMRKMDKLPTSVSNRRIKSNSFDVTYLEREGVPSHALTKPSVGAKMIQKRSKASDTVVCLISRLT